MTCWEHGLEVIPGRLNGILASKRNKLKLSLKVAKILCLEKVLRSLKLPRTIKIFWFTPVL